MIATRLLVCISVSVCLSLSVYADTIILKNGKEITYRKVYYTNDEGVTFLCRDGLSFNQWSELPWYQAMALDKRNCQLFFKNKAREYGLPWIKEQVIAVIESNLPEIKTIHGIYTSLYNENRAFESRFEKKAREYRKKQDEKISRLYASLEELAVYRKYLKKYKENTNKKQELLTLINLYQELVINADFPQGEYYAFPQYSYQMIYHVETKLRMVH